MNPPKSRENSITRYYIAEENLAGSVKEQKADYDLMAAVMICLGKEEDSGTEFIEIVECASVHGRQVHRTSARYWRKRFSYQNDSDIGK